MVPLGCGDEEGDEFGERERSDEGEWDVCSRARDPISSMKEGRDAIGEINDMRQRTRSYKGSKVP